MYQETSNVWFKSLKQVWEESLSSIADIQGSTGPLAVVNIDIEILLFFTNYKLTYLFSVP